MNVARVRLRKSNRVFPFNCSVAVDRGQPCIVRTENGLEWGVCVTAPGPAQEDGEAETPESQVVRKATDEDWETFRQIIEEERKSFQTCAERIRGSGLDMKLVDVEYTFDKRKVIIYFTAELRVDFRELVRDLAHALKTRIELRHIQVRDQAKMVGGLGECGRPLCCHSWLCEFLPISMKMAKRQNLSLNPEKISGQCGRLMCCLSYENEQYDVKKKKCAQEPTAGEADANETGDSASADASASSEPAPPPRKPKPAPRPMHQEVIIADPETVDELFADDEEPQGDDDDGDEAMDDDGTDTGGEGGDDQASTTESAGGEGQRKRRRRRRRRKPGQRPEGGAHA